MTSQDGVAPTTVANADAKIEVNGAIRSLWKFAFAVTVIGLLAFAALATVTVWILISVHTGQQHGAQHTQEILNTVTSHNNDFKHIIANQCLLLKNNGIPLPSYCLPKG